MAAMTHDEFLICRNRIKNRVDDYAKKLLPIFEKLEHKWQHGSVPNGWDILYTIQHLCDCIEWKEGESFFRASTGGICIEFIKWPSGTVEYTCHYISEAVFYGIK